MNYLRRAVNNNTNLLCLTMLLGLAPSVRYAESINLIAPEIP